MDWNVDREEYGEAVYKKSNGNSVGQLFQNTPIKYKVDINAIELTMVGMRHQSNTAKKVYNELKADKTKDVGFRLVLENENIVSPNAIAVYATYPKGAFPVRMGYIKDEQAKVLRNLFPGWTADLGIDVKAHHSVREFYTILQVGYEHLFKHRRKSAVLPDYASTEEFPEVRESNTKYINSEKDKIMNSLVDKNVQIAQNAAFLEAGRIANNQAVKVVGAKAPLMVKGYVDTAFGKLLIANAASVAAEKLRPQDKRLEKLTRAMITEAWQEVYQTFDFEKMVDEMLSNASVKAALIKIDESAPAA